MVENFFCLIVQYPPPFLKTCILGRPCTGKTSLLEALAGKEFLHGRQQTDGIVLRKLTLESVPLGEENVRLFNPLCNSSKGEEPPSQL